MPNPLPIISWGETTPASSSGFHNAGEIVMDPTPTAGKIAGWVCTAEGTPGTWVPLVRANQGARATMTAAAQIPSGSSQVDLTMAAGTVTFPVAANHSAGHEMVIKNLANASMTLATAAGATYFDAAAVTLAQFGVVRIQTDGTTWYKAT